MRTHASPSLPERPEEVPHLATLDLAPPDLAHGCRVLELDITTVVESRETRTETWVDRSTYIPRTVETITYLNLTHLTSLEIVQTRSLTE